MKVAILGCGPTGLIAAHAAATLGHEVTIFSRKVKSPTFGAMYLHEPIPGVSPTDPEIEVHIVKIGTREGYAQNVYGDPNAPVSWDKFQDGPSPAWDLAATYGKLWGMYVHRIKDMNLTSMRIDRIARHYDRVFSTVPTDKLLCFDWQHKFTFVEICIVHGQTDDVNPANVMYYNGLPEAGYGNWYRYSIIRGYQSWEYARQKISPVEGMNISYGIKPLTTNCNCRPGVVRLGRFGKWDKHAFTHHAYREVRNALLSV